MQTHGGASAEEAVTSPERKFHHKFMVDWNRDGLYTHAMSDLSQYVQSATTDRTLKGSAPESLQLVEGSSAAQLTVEMGGDYTTDLSIADIFSPYQIQSPFYGSDIIGVECYFHIGIETAVGVVWYPQFIGSVRTITPDRGAFNVTITALDRSELLRRPVQFPPWAMMNYQAQFENSVISQLADSQWVIDHCLRNADISPTPSRPTTLAEHDMDDSSRIRCQFWLNGTGSYLPTIGFLDNYDPFKFPNDADDTITMYTVGAAHPDSPSPDTKPLAIGGTGDSYGNYLAYWAEDNEKIQSNGVQVMGFTMITNPDSQNGDYFITAPNQLMMRVDFGDRYYGEIWIGGGNARAVWGDAEDGISYSTDPVAIPTGQDYVRLDAAFDAFHAAGVKAFMRAGTNSTGPGWDTIHTPALAWESRNWDYKGLIQILHRQPFIDAYYSSTNFGGGTPETWIADWGPQDATHVAVLDSGFNRFSHLPVLQVDDAWQLIAEVAAAEFGSVFWDENGVFRFWNYETISMLQNDHARVLTLDDLTGLRFTDFLDAVTNIITVEATDRRSFVGTIFTNESEWDFYIPSGTRVTHRINVPGMQTHSPASPTRFETVDPGGAIPDWTPEVIHGYVTQFLHTNDNAWYEDDTYVGDLDINVWRDSDGNLVVTIWNGWPSAARLWTNTNEPGLRISGTKMGQVTSKTYTYEDLDSINKYGGRNMRLSGPWYQEYHNVTGGISMLLHVTKDPVPDTDAITIAGDPRLQLGDTLRVTDPEGFGARFDMQIFGITRTYSVDRGLTDTLGVKLIRTLGGIWDDNQYGIWEDTFVWVTDMPFDPSMALAVPGDVASSSEYNKMRSNVLDLDARVTGISSAQPFCQVYQSSTGTQTIPQSTSTAITFNAEVVDVGNFHSTVSNISRITPTVAGRYECIGGIAWNTNNNAVVNNKYANGQFRKNGAQLLGSAPYSTVLLYQSAFVAPMCPVFATIVVNGTTDYIELWGTHEVAGGMETYSNASYQHSFMMVRYVSAT